MLTNLLSITEEKDKHILMHIYENHRRDMFIAAMSIVHNRQIAEDVVQDTFIRIIDKMHLIKKISCNGLRSYIVLITRSVAINMINKNNRHKVVPLEDFEYNLSSDDSWIDEMAAHREMVDHIRKSLNEMDEKYSYPMLLRYYYGFSDSEAADLLGIDSASTVRSRCHRGKKMIIDKMKQGGGNN